MCIGPAETNDVPVISLGDLVLGEVVSDTPVSTVWRAQWRGEDVAVRRAKIKTMASITRYEHTLKMAKLLRTVEGLLPLSASIPHGPDYCIITPWISGGSLHHLLYTADMPIHNPQQKSELAKFTLPRVGTKARWEFVVDTAIQIVSAVARMHELELCHRDIKPSNLLYYTDEDKLKLLICDFETTGFEADIQSSVGVDRYGGPSGGRLVQMVGTIEYMAPELLLGKPASMAADIYSLGITLNELSTGLLPFKDSQLDDPMLYTILDNRFTMTQLISAIAGQSLRPRQCVTATPQFAQLIERCWNVDAHIRPSANDVLVELLDMKAKRTHLDRCYDNPSLATKRVEDNVLDANALTRSYSPSPILPSPAPSLTPACAYQAQTPYRPDVSFGVFADPGQRGADRMEDRHFVELRWNDSTDTHIFAVFDGHGGDECAKFVNENMCTHLKVALEKVHDMELALPLSFVSVDEAFSKDNPHSKAGCTATVVVVEKDRLLVANAGDCRVILAVDNGGTELDVEQATDIHCASNKKEADRIRALGGTISRAREGDALRVNGLVQVTRAVGDIALKPYLTPNPDVTVRALDENVMFMIICCDGVWDMLSNRALCNIVRDTVKVPDMITKRICMEALTRGSTDNVTCALAFFRPVSTGKLHTTKLLLNLGMEMEEFDKSVRMHLLGAGHERYHYHQISSRGAPYQKIGATTVETNHEYVCISWMMYSMYHLSPANHLNAGTVAKRWSQMYDV
eukprot:CFRG3992T1